LEFSGLQISSLKLIDVDGLTKSTCLVMYFARAEPPVAASSAINALPLVTVMTLAAAAVVMAPATKILAPDSKTSKTLYAALFTDELATVTVVPLMIPDTFALSLTDTILI